MKKENIQYFCEGCRTMHDGVPYLVYSYGTKKNYCEKLQFTDQSNIWL